MEHAMEPPLVAVGVSLDVAPRSPIANVPALDRHREPARPEPLDDQLRIDVGAVDEVAWGVELPADVDERDAWLGGDRGLRHGASSSIRRDWAAHWRACLAMPPGACPGGHNSRLS